MYRVFHCTHTNDVKRFLHIYIGRDLRCEIMVFIVLYVSFFLFIYFFFNVFIILCIRFEVNNVVKKKKKQLYALFFAGFMTARNLHGPPPPL